MRQGIINKISRINFTTNHTGFGLYDRKIIDFIKKINDPYPYFRGLLDEIGFEFCTVNYNQPIRKKGKSKVNLYSLYDIGLLAITTYSILPLRTMAISGFILSILTFIISITFLFLKLAFWNRFNAGIAPILIGSFFFFSIQLLCFGIIGEYLINITNQCQKRPLVIEKERINFPEVDSL